MTSGQRVAAAIAALVVLGGGGFFVMRGRAVARASAAGVPSASADARPVPVTVATAVEKDVPVVAEGLGTVTPLATVVVKTQVDGRLDKVAFKEGDAVKKGDLLAIVDARPFAIQLQSGKAALARDSANLANAKKNLDRYAALRQQNLIPQQQLDDQQATVAQLDAATKADEATIAGAQLNLEYARIVSPIDGVTGVRLVDQGNIVHPNDASGIVIVTQLDPIAVVFTLPQDELPRVQNALKSGKPHVEAYARDGAKKLAAGQLELVDNQVNAQTATIRLKATMPNVDRRLWPNQFVKARVNLDTIAGALVVPAAAVQRNTQGTFVYVVGPDKSAQNREVTVATIEGEDAIVTKGLRPGDVVVTDGQNQLKPGAKVAPRAPGGDKPSKAPKPADKP